jgi:hypothetical protein
MRNTFPPDHTQLACQVSERPFYQQKTNFSAERISLDAQSLRKVAQNVRAMSD